MNVLVTGPTGYIGGRLIPRLLEAGHRVRVLARSPQKLAGRSWSSEVEALAGDVLDRPSLERALEGQEAAYYLVHSMGGEGDFRALDREAANNFVAAGGQLRQTVYLGGLLPDAPSDHLASRAEVGEILRAGLPTTEFRAGPIVGSGSASFEMVRYLAERVPFFLAPRGVHNLVQPVGINDVLAYLVASLRQGEPGVVEIGADRLSFGGMLKEYAALRGLRRPIWEVPLVTPGLCAAIVGRLTPIPTSLAAPLLEGIAHSVVARGDEAARRFPEITPTRYAQAATLAIEGSDRAQVETSWRSAGGRGEARRVDWEGLYREMRAVHVDAPPERVFRAFCSLGGDRGWEVWNWMWTVRGWVDVLIGGPGLRRGRRHPYELHPGEALDVWRVEAVEPPRRLLLRAEMKLPGRAWLEFEARPDGAGTLLVITGLMEPRGLPGWLYWWSTWPYHRFGFAELARRLGREARL